MHTDLEEEFFLRLGDVQLQVSAGSLKRSRAIELLEELLAAPSVTGAPFEDQLECRRRVIDWQFIFAAEAGENEAAKVLLARRLVLGFDTLARQVQFFLLAATVARQAGLGTAIARQLRSTRAALVADEGNEAGWDYSGMMQALNKSIESLG